MLGTITRRGGDVALRFSIVFVIAASIALTAGIYEVDRREKSSSETVADNLKNFNERVEVLADQIRILTAQFTSQSNDGQRQVQSVRNEVQALEMRLKELENQNTSRRPR